MIRDMSEKRTGRDGMLQPELAHYAQEGMGQYEHLITWTPEDQFKSIRYSGTHLPLFSQ